MAITIAATGGGITHTTALTLSVILLQSDEHLN
jgi:hypothetical protein